MRLQCNDNDTVYGGKYELIFTRLIYFDTLNRFELLLRVLMMFAI